MVVLRGLPEPGGSPPRHAPASLSRDPRETDGKVGRFQIDAFTARNVALSCSEEREDIRIGFDRTTYVEDAKRIDQYPMWRPVDEIGAWWPARR